MGKTLVTVKFTNSHDIALAKRNIITAEQIRVLTTAAVVDTGAMLTSIPQALVDQLGLDIMEYRTAKYADGRKEKKGIAGGLLVEIQGRTSETRCVVEPHSETVLIGQIVLEEMDWAVNPAQQCLIPGHEGYDQGLIEMYFIF